MFLSFFFFFSELPVAVAQPLTTQESLGSVALPAIPKAQLITLGDKNAFRSGFNAMQIYEPAEANINL